MSAFRRIRLSSTNLDELAGAVSAIYCRNTTVFARSRTAVRGLFETRYAGTQPVVDLRYGVRAKVDAGEFPRLMLIRTCLDGSGLARQQGVSIVLRKGETVPMSAGLSTQVEIDACFAQRSVKLDIDRVEAQCARMLSHPLDAGLRFALRPFSASLEKAWGEAVNLMTAYANMNVTLPNASAASLDEFVISLVLNGHHHNYTDELEARPRMLPPRLIREAEQLMKTEDCPLTVSEIAARLRVSVRSLERGFREHLRTTPLQHLRAIRLERVRSSLRAPQISTTVTSTALEHGFVHLARFSAHYKAAFGESPSQTLRRGRISIPSGV